MFSRIGKKKTKHSRYAKYSDQFLKYENQCKVADMKQLTILLLLVYCLVYCTTKEFQWTIKVGLVRLADSIRKLLRSYS